MIVYPAIDLKNGQCVRLYQGDFSKETIVNPDPIKQSIEFEEQGAHALHIVDLDGALQGDVSNFSVIEKKKKNIKIPIHVGGGIRSIEKIAAYLEIGVSRVILGSVAVENPELVKEAVKMYQDQIIVGIDARDGFVATHGWLTVSNQNYIDLAQVFEKEGVKTIIFTDIAKDGTLAGPNLEQLATLVEAVPKVNIIASGGISDREDLKAVKNLGVYGVISGKALYNGNLSITDVVEMSDDDAS